MATAAQDHVIVLVKTDGTFGGLRVGAKQTTSHPADQTRDEAVAHAFGMLKRSNPDENPMCWQEEVPV